METEIKLLVAAKDLNRVLQSRPVQRCAQGDIEKGAFTSVYYDTPRFDLRDAHLALRLRRIRTERGLRWVQTLKGGAASTASLTEREEYE